MNKLEEFISHNELDKALEYLLSDYSLNDKNRGDIINLSGQLVEIQRQKLLNIATREEIEINTNRIREAILHFGNKLKQKITTKAPTKNNNYNFDYNNFIGIGNEPGWSLKISRKNILFVSGYGSITHAYEITQSFLRENIWHFRSNKTLSLKQMYISITITKEVWQDDMSGIEFPFRVEITENFKHYIGVGQIQIS